MTPEKINSTPETKTSIDSQDNVVASIVIKTIATLAIGGAAWYFMQHMI